LLLLALGGGLLGALAYLGARAWRATPAVESRPELDAASRARADSAPAPASRATASMTREAGPAPPAPDRPHRRAARRSPPRPAPTPAEPPAAAAAATGYLTVGSRDYATVVVDGVRRGPSPLIKAPLPAGEHEVKLLDPVSGKLLARKLVRVAPGEHRYLTHP
jgi:hypothetical protein